MLAWPVGGLADQVPDTFVAPRLLGPPQIGQGIWAAGSFSVTPPPFYNPWVSQIQAPGSRQGSSGQGSPCLAPSPDLSRAGRRFEEGDCAGACVSLCVTGGQEVTRWPPQVMSALIGCALMCHSPMQVTVPWLCFRLDMVGHVYVRASRQAHGLGGHLFGSPYSGH